MQGAEDFEREGAMSCYAALKVQVQHIQKDHVAWGSRTGSCLSWNVLCFKLSGCCVGVRRLSRRSGSPAGQRTFLEAVERLRGGLSPEQIAFTLRSMPDPERLSHETIYTALYAMLRGMKRLRHICSGESWIRSDLAAVNYRILSNRE